ncbi:MAG: carbon-nitrogen hydrolase family protein [Proteobacteria bacterium]|nr:carbon-nitrogen hydrolase family protein [Pseudomonadota bacterium]
MRVTVCQLANERQTFAADWSALCAHVRQERSELVVLPEMPFSVWFAAVREFAQRDWSAAVAAHTSWESRLDEMAATVLGTRPVDRNRRRLNEAFVAAADGLSAAHYKRYLPDEDGFWEASWYERGDGSFVPVDAAGTKIGFQICTELWMLDRSRQYGLQGVEIIAVPRATPESSRERWLVGGRAAAIVAGAYCLSSNRSGDSGTGFRFAGQGWIVDPNGDVLALTSEDQPFVTRDIDLQSAVDAKSTYPRYVR